MPGVGTGVHKGLRLAHGLAAEGATFGLHRLVGLIYTGSDG